MEQTLFFSETGLLASQHPKQYVQWVMSNIEYRLKMQVLECQCLLDECLQTLKVNSTTVKEKTATRVIRLEAA